MKHATLSQLDVMRLEAALERAGGTIIRELCGLGLWPDTDGEELPSVGDFQTARRVYVARMVHLGRSNGHTDYAIAGMIARTLGVSLRFSRTLITSVVAGRGLFPEPVRRAPSPTGHSQDSPASLPLP
jgi:hypothetical protein